MFLFTILGQYISSSFILPFLVTLIFVLTFLLTFQMIKIVGLVLSTGLPLIMVFKLVGHMIIYTLPIAFPLAILFATLFLFNRLSLDSEYTAMRSFGLSKNKIFLPVLVMGVLLSFLISELSKNVIPYSAAEFKNTVAFLTSKGYITSIKEGSFFTDIPNITLFSEKVENEGTDLKNVFINFRGNSESASKENVIFAAKGKLIKKNEHEMGAASLRLKLYEGNITKYDKTGRELEKILFQEYDFPISSGTMIQGSAVKDSMRSNTELREIIFAPEKTREEKGISKKDFINAQIEYYSRYNTALQCLIFVILGFVLGIQPTRGQARNSGLMTLLILVAYYIIFFAGISIAKAGKVPPFYVVYLPTFITSIVAIWFYKKIDWVS
jgi:lipopolysaccharide export system permease protein